MITSESSNALGLRHTVDLPACRVLVVEDDDDMRDVLVEELSGDGHAVRGCARIDEALGVLENEPYDVLITDVRLPGGSGLELLHVLHTRGGHAPARIVITGFGSAELHDSAESLGAVAVFDKPFDVEDLRTAVINVAS